MGYGLGFGLGRGVIKAVLAGAICIYSAAAWAGPSSLDYPTRTDDLLQNDFMRIADVAASIVSMSGRLSYHMYDIDSSHCHLIGGCYDAVTNYVNPMVAAAKALADQARYYYNNTNFDHYGTDMKTLRESYFNTLAVKQWEFRELIKNSGASQIGLGNGNADNYCSYIFDSYWILMNMIVDYARAAGLGGGRGSDD